MPQDDQHWEDYLYNPKKNNKVDVIHTTDTQTM